MMMMIERLSEVERLLSLLLLSLLLLLRRVELGLESLRRWQSMKRVDHL